MSTGRKRSALSYIPGYTNNAVLQVIIYSGVAFVMLGMVWGIIQIVYQGDATNFDKYFLANVALPSLAGFKAHWWTIFIFGWFHFNGFFDLLSDMLWLYCFGSVVQMLVGHRQIIPLFIYSFMAGGVVYLLAQLLPGDLGKCPPQILGPRAAMVGMAAAAVALTPAYRFYITETFRVHILVVAGIFAFLMIMSSGFYLTVFLMLVGGGLMGYAYIRLLKAGYRPGSWMYSFAARLESVFTPNERALSKKRVLRAGDMRDSMFDAKSGISQRKIDDILDKINQKGYNSLTAEEKEFLMRAGKE